MDDNARVGIADHRYELVLGPDPISSQSDHSVAQKIPRNGKKWYLSYNMGFPIYFAMSAIPTLTLSSIKFQPFGIGRSLSPF